MDRGCRCFEYFAYGRELLLPEPKIETDSYYNLSSYVLPGPSSTRSYLNLDGRQFAISDSGKVRCRYGTSRKSVLARLSLDQTKHPHGLGGTVYPGSRRLAPYCPKYRVRAFGISGAFCRLPSSGVSLDLNPLCVLFFFPLETSDWPRSTWMQVDRREEVFFSLSVLHQGNRYGST